MRNYNVKLYRPFQLTQLFKMIDDDDYALYLLLKATFPCDQCTEEHIPAINELFSFSKFFVVVLYHFHPFFFFLFLVRLIFMCLVSANFFKFESLLIFLKY